MTRDLLSVQALTIALKSAFPIGDMILCHEEQGLTRTSLVLCITEDHLDATKRIRHISSLKGERDIEEQLHDVKVETGFAISLSDEEIALEEATND
ncbi:hypothetical protein Tco_0664971 [Tanacetum coccineum]